MMDPASAASAETYPASMVPPCRRTVRLSAGKLSTAGTGESGKVSAGAGEEPLPKRRLVATRAGRVISPKRKAVATGGTMRMHGKILAPAVAACALACGTPAGAQ